jgi:hypothetical protein
MLASVSVTVERKNSGVTSRATMTSTNHSRKRGVDLRWLIEDDLGGCKSKFKLLSCKKRVK